MLRSLTAPRATHQSSLAVTPKSASPTPHPTLPHLLSPPAPAPTPGTKLSTLCPITPALSALVSALDTLRSWVDEIPPTEQSLRYGNPSFRTWFARMAAAAPGFVRQAGVVNRSACVVP